jgi:hypothetical protein
MSRDEIPPILLIKTVCREYPFRRNARGLGKTEYILFDTVVFQRIKPVRITRSRSGSHGFDMYCLPEETWKDIAVVRIEESTSGKLSYSIQSQKPLTELEERLMLASSFNEMIGAVLTYLRLKRGEK